MIDFLNSLDQSSVLFGGLFVVFTHIFATLFTCLTLAGLKKLKSFKERDKT